MLGKAIGEPKTDALRDAIQVALKTYAILTQQPIRLTGKDGAEAYAFDGVGQRIAGARTHGTNDQHKALLEQWATSGVLRTTNAPIPAPAPVANAEPANAGQPA